MKNEVSVNITNPKLGQVTEISYDISNGTLKYYIVENGCLLSDVPETIARYFDYEAFGRDLGIEGKFYNIDGDMVEIN